MCFSLALMAGLSLRPLEHETTYCILVSFPDPPRVCILLKKSERGRERKEGLVSPFTRPSFPMGRVHREFRDETSQTLMHAEDLESSLYTDLLHCNHECSTNSDCRISDYYCITACSLNHARSIGVLCV